MNGVLRNSLLRDAVPGNQRFWHDPFFISARGAIVWAALKQGSITVAAEAMHVAPSAIASAHFQAEEAFGMALVTPARAIGLFPTLAWRDVKRRIDDL